MASIIREIVSHPEGRFYECRCHRDPITKHRANKTMTRKDLEESMVCQYQQFREDGKLTRDPNAPEIRIAAPRGSEKTLIDITFRVSSMDIPVVMRYHYGEGRSTFHVQGCADEFDTPIDLVDRFIVPTTPEEGDLP